MLSIAVLDDQSIYHDLIDKITNISLRKEGIDYKIWFYTSPEDLLYDIEKDDKYDIYLLDVELPTATGLEVARKIRELYYDPFIIYITNYVEYAVEAYETNAFRYIPKKLLEEKLPEAYVSICKEIEGKKEKYYVIEKNHQLEKINYRDIYYVKKDEKYIVIVHKNGVSRERTTLTEFMNKSMEYGTFIAIDKTCLVNMLHVISLKERQVQLRNGEAIQVSTPKLSYVKQEILRLWKD